MDATNTFRQGGRARWAVAAIFGVNGFLVGSWAPQIPLVLPRLGITPSTLGLLIFCFGVGALVSMPWCGWLMARHGQRPVLQTFAVVQAFGMLLVVLSHDVRLAAVAMVAFGATIGCTDVAMNAATVTVERRLSRAVMSSMHGFWSLGGFAGSALGGFLIQNLGAALHAALVAAVALAIAVAAVPHLLGREAEAVPAAEKDKGGFALPKTPVIYLLGVLALIGFISEGAVLDWGALFMSQERGAAVAVAGLAYAFFAGAMAAMRFAGDAIRNRFGAVATMRASSLIGALAMLAAALLPHPLLVIAAFAVSGIGLANTVPIAFSAAGNQPNIPSGTGMSVATTMGYAGILFAPGSIGFFGERFGFAPVFVLMSLLLFVVFLMSGLTAAADVKNGQE
jgi:predicted MFS family arabinose efflux permease